MKKVLCIVAALAYLSNVHSQNNYPSESPLYYNLKDTITSQWKESVEEAGSSEEIPEENSEE